jgi:hypothetical protein
VARALAVSLEEQVGLAELGIEQGAVIRPENAAKAVTE